MTEVSFSLSATSDGVTISRESGEEVFLFWHEVQCIIDLFGGIGDEEVDG